MTRQAQHAPRICRGTALVLVALLLTGCPTLIKPAGEPRSIHASGSYTHAASGFTFPESVNRFRRVSIHVHDASEQAIVGYNVETTDARIALTLYVLPARRDPSGVVRDLPTQFELECGNVVQQHAGAVAGERWTPPRTANGEQTPGHAAMFHFSDSFAQEQQQLESLLYLFEFDGWHVKYRITYPYALRSRAAEEARGFVSSFRWRNGA